MFTLNYTILIIISLIKEGLFAQIHAALKTKTKNIIANIFLLAEMCERAIGLSLAKGSRRRNRGGNGNRGAGGHAFILFII